MVRDEQRHFVLGANYWPATRAMYWWQDFDAAEVSADLSRMAAGGMSHVRVFLLWEEFQPAPDIVSPAALRCLVRLADIAAEHGVSIMPTLFCGHMSGINWLPGWVLGPAREYVRFRFPVWSGGHQLTAGIRNWYADREIIRAQQLQCREVARALAGHPAIWAYDLGNESSNCVLPPDRNAARSWLEIMVGEIKQYGGDCPVTLGMHAEDLENDRHLWPQDAALWCDWLCMHGYPFYLAWVDDPGDVRVLPFLGLLTRWLGGKPVLFEEFGAPSRPMLPPYPDESELLRYKCRLWDEAKVATYYQQALELLCRAGMTGAMAWSYGDYHPSLWDRPPLRENPHERHFGLFRHDGSPKPAVQAISEFAGRLAAGLGPAVDQLATGWLRGEDPERYYQSPQTELPRLYRKYCDVRSEK
ncbi:MAG: hypothetical protein ABSC17_09555 [Thermacetogeniaceae bacterium]